MATDKHTLAKQQAYNMQKATTMASLLAEREARVIDQGMSREVDTKRSIQHSNARPVRRKERQNVEGVSHRVNAQGNSLKY